MIQGQEIISDLNLSSIQESMLMKHSFLNIINVLTTNLQFFKQEYAVNGYLDEVIEEAFSKSRLFKQPVNGHEHATGMDVFETKVMLAVNECLRMNPGEERKAECAELVDNIINILRVLMVHSREVIARNGEPDKWEKFSCYQIRENLVQFLFALEKNSRGKFRIVYSPEEQRENDYLVKLEISGRKGKYIRIPDVFRDVMRDIIANARKYTSPGGRFSAILTEEKGMITFVVEDNGRGIPADEVESIVRFSIRASNVGPHETKGAGFGLTKAYFITKQFNGRMWIKSAPEQGTTVTIKIPVP